MPKAFLTHTEISTIAEDVLNHCYGNIAINQDIVDRVTSVISTSLEKIMEQRNKIKDPYPYLISEDELRKVFEEQHQNRDLRRGRKGTYQSPQIAAIWNQHVRSARAIEKLLTERITHGVIAHA